MRTERALRLRAAALDKLQVLGNMAVSYGVSQVEFSSRYAEILDGLRKAKCPEYIVAYVSGYVTRMREEWYHRELAYCHKALDGTLYSAHKGAVAAGIALDVDAIYKAHRGHEIPAWESAHYWITASARELSHGRPAKVH